MAKNRNRDRAWRRRQRARVIRNRKDRVPEERTPTPVYLWQLHGSDGKPLDLLHRSSTAPEPGETEIEVVIKHSYGCTMRAPRWVYDHQTETCGEESTCTCHGVEPYWGYPLRPDPGSVWKFIREYTPDSRPFPESRLDKTPDSATSPYKGWRNTSKDTGNMKFSMNNHRGKKFVGWFYLGMDLQRTRHWREWEESWGGSYWGDPETEEG